MEGRLNEKQQAFCREYIIDFNGTQAAIRAGYSEKTARQVASENLSKPDIQAFVSELCSARALRTELEADAVLEQLRRIVFFDPRKLLNDDGTPRGLHELDDETVAAIAGLDIGEMVTETDGEVVTRGVVKKYKISDRLAAIQAAMKHLGIQGAEKIDGTIRPGAPNLSGVPREKLERIRAILREPDDGSQPA